MSETQQATAAEAGLLAAAKAGDAAALEELLERQQPRLFRFGLKMCRNADDAGDILQDTLLAMARTLPAFRGESSVATWMYTIARRYCLKKRRRRAGAPEAFEPLRGDEPDSRCTPEDDAIRSERTAALDEAIGTLTPPYREVLLLRDVEGLSAPEVARVLGIGVDAVKSRLHRARRAVRDALSPRGPDPGTGCPDVVGLLSRKLEGQVTPALCAEMEKHVQSCGRCEALCASLRESLALCAALPAPEVPAERRAAIRRLIRAS